MTVLFIDQSNVFKELRQHDMLMITSAHKLRYKHIKAIIQQADTVYIDIHFLYYLENQNRTAKGMSLLADLFEDISIQDDRAILLLRRSTSSTHTPRNKAIERSCNLRSIHFSDTSQNWVDSLLFLESSATSYLFSRRKYLAERKKEAPKKTLMQRIVSLSKRLNIF